MNQFLIEYYTDPLCCWSWAMEPQMRKLRYLLKERSKITYIMGGLLKDWKHYSDDMNKKNIGETDVLLELPLALNRREY